MSLLKYQKSFVCYFDVLGFRSFINDKQKVETYFEIIIDSLKRVINEVNLGSDIKHHLISDAVVIAISAEGQNLTSKLRELLGKVALIQYYLAVNNIWVRGSITYGEIGFSDDGKVISGVALAEAYELEKLAVYPRVIIDPRICAELNMTKTNLVSVINIQSKDLGANWIYDEDKAIYIPNMREMRDYLFVNFMTIATRRHADVITEVERIYSNLRSNMYSLPPQIQKYQWVRDYISSSNEINSLTVKFQYL